MAPLQIKRDNRIISMLIGSKLEYHSCSTSDEIYLQHQHPLKSHKYGLKKMVRTQLCSYLVKVEKPLAQVKHVKTNIEMKYSSKEGEEIINNNK